MSLHLLIIDDDPIVLDSCRKVFVPEGYEVAVTVNPREGLELASRNSYDVILCDWQMPEFNGMDVVERLNDICPHATVVMISGYPTVNRATDAMRRGAMDFVSKPFTPAQILEAVQKATRDKIRQEKKTIGRLESVLKSFQFPLPNLEDKAPRTIAETVASTVGVGKAKSPWFSVVVLGVLAGAYIGFGGLLSTSVTFDLAARAGFGIRKLVGGAAFSLGLMLVVIAGAELFTGNNLMVSSVMSREISLKTMFKHWGVVYAANFIGSLLLVFLFLLSGLWKVGNGALGADAVATGYAKVSLSFTEAMVRGVGCNWLVCLAVWMALAARQTSGKILAIFFPITGFVAIGFEHCVANMYFVPAAILLKTWVGIEPPLNADPNALCWITFLWKNLLPVTIGNIIGGAVFVGLSYWGAYLGPSAGVKEKTA